MEPIYPPNSINSNDYLSLFCQLKAQVTTAYFNGCHRICQIWKNDWLYLNSTQIILIFVRTPLLGGSSIKKRDTSLLDKLMRKAGGGTLTSALLIVLFFTVFFALNS